MSDFLPQIWFYFGPKLKLYFGVLTNNGLLRTIWILYLIFDEFFNHQNFDHRLWYTLCLFYVGFLTTILVRFRIFDQNVDYISRSWPYFWFYIGFLTTILFFFGFLTKILIIFWIFWLAFSILSKDLEKWSNLVIIIYSKSDIKLKVIPYFATDK